MSSFENLRIVDNFYQTSLFFPMPTVVISTLCEDGSTSLGPYSLVQPYYVAGKDYYAMLLECRNSSNTAQHILKTGKCAINFITDEPKYFKECVKLSWPGDTPADKMPGCKFKLEKGLIEEENPDDKRPMVLSEAFQVIECTWMRELDGADKDQPGQLTGYEPPYHDFNGIKSKFGAHFILRVDQILMKTKYKNAIINGVRAKDFPNTPVDYGYRDSKNFWYHRHRKMIAELLPIRNASLESVRYASDRADDKVKFTDDALKTILNVPRVFLPLVLKGCVDWAKENNVDLITEEHMKIINDKRAKEKKKRTGRNMSKRFGKMFFRSLLLFSGLLILGVLATGCNGGRNDPVRTPEPASVPVATEEPEPDDFKDKPSDYYTELFRQQIHFSPEKGWINDPNGLVYFNGEYHLFYQYCPENPAGGYMCWGHAVSTDLIHWEELGIAIPYASNYQIWSGSCVVDENNVSGLFNEAGKGLIAFYTKLSNHQEQCIAYSSDNGRTWQDYNEGKPVLKYTDDPVSGKDKSGNTGFRDPKVVFCEEAGTWLMVVAGDALRIYASDDLLNWEFQLSYEKDQTLDDRSVKSIYTECPDLFKMRIEGTDEYKWVLSLAGRSYMVGYVKNISGKWAFVPETDFITMNYGPDAYAGQTYFGTPDGRRILINWMSSPQNRAKQLSWTPDQCGSMTIQTELKLVKTDDGPRLSILPIKEMSQLERINPVKVMTNKPSESLFNGFSKEIYKLDLEIDGGVALVSMYGGAATLKYSADSGLLVFDRTDTGFGGKYTVEIPSHDGKMSLTIYVDIASVEIYADDGLYVASFLTYDTYDYGMDVSYSGSVNSLTVTATELNSIWRDLRYTKVEPEPLSLPSDIVVPLGQEITLAVGGMRLFTNTDLTWEITEGKEAAEIVSAKGGSVNIRGLSEGSFTLKVSRGDETVCGTYTVVEDAFKTNMDSFTAVGTWQESLQKGLTVNSGGDSFYTSNTPFEGNFRMTVKASAETCVAIGLTLGVKNVSAPSGESYVVNFDFNRKDFRVFHFNGCGAEDVSSKSFNNAGVTPEKNKIYTIVLTYTDGHITYEIDGNMVFEDVNLSLNGKYAGIMCYSGAAVFREFTLEELP